MNCGMRRATKNGSHGVAKRCLYCSEEPFFRGTLTTPAAGELGVALRDATGGEMGLKHEHDRQHTFTGGLQRVHETLDYLVNDKRKRVQTQTRRLFRADCGDDRIRDSPHAVRRLDGTPASSAGRSRAVFSSLKSCGTGGDHPLALFDNEGAHHPLGVKILTDVFTNGSRRPRHIGSVNDGADMRHLAPPEHFRHISASFGPRGRTSFCRCTP